MASALLGNAATAHVGQLDVRRRIFAAMESPNLTESPAWAHLRTWLIEYDRMGLLKLAELERRAGVPATILDKWYHKRPHRGKVRVPADSHLAGIYRALEPFNYAPPSPNQ